jgi:hypothetical protein
VDGYYPTRLGWAGWYCGHANIVWKLDDTEYDDS